MNENLTKLNDLKELYDYAQKAYFTSYRLFKAGHVKKYVKDDFGRLFGVATDLFDAEMERKGIVDDNGDYQEGSEWVKSRLASS